MDVKNLLKSFLYIQDDHHPKNLTTSALKLLADWLELDT